MENRNLEGKIERPEEVVEIARFLWFNSLFFLILLFAILVFSPNGGECMASIFIGISAINAFVALEFYRLHKWTIPLMNFLIGPIAGWKGSGDLYKKLRKPNVRHAFGLPPVETYGESNSGNSQFKV